VVGLPSGAPWACEHNPGGNCLDLQGATNTPSVIESKTSFDLLAGSTYTLTFGALLQGFAATDPAQTTFTVSLGSFSRLLTSTGAGETYSLSYTPVANQSGVRLGFASASFPDAYHGAVIDNILLTSTPGAVVPQVPEPGTYALMLAGLAAVGLVAGRRRRGG
jgi:PEP-CTERM motif